eukprot:Seg2803.5 transcript_id=Seg2803.5/GoldUCD/mRNA.D3Y31 product="High affinity cationic amino acid transporter 1" protein_id=Seg2803.5/GoldUCD/D3Y31
MGAALQGFSRTKSFDMKSVQESKLARVLTTFDLTFLGVGSTLGAGVYVVTGDVARDIAGPGVVLSFLVAGIASVLSGLCYAEFGARVPKAGSAYIYSYVTVGELCAFIIGWNLFLEYMIGAAAVARAWSSYFNSLVGGAVSKGLTSAFGSIHTPGLSHYLDIFALALALIIAGVLSVGVRKSTRFQGTITFVNMAVILFIVIVGAFHAKPENWSNNFLPFGVTGVLSGSATAFFAFVGFDVIASTGEEAKNPSRAIPLSIVISLAICYVGYSGVAAVVTLMIPYNELDLEAALPRAFEQRGISWAKYVISVGALCGLTASLTGAMFPLPRLLYAMSTDGLIFKPFGWVNSKTETPVFSTFVAGTLAGTLAMIFELSSLVEMMSIGTLQAYTIVATSVLLLRYQPGVVGMAKKADSAVQSTGDVEREPTERTGQLVSLCVCILFLDMFGISALFVFGMRLMLKGNLWCIVLAFVLMAILVSTITVIVLQPQNRNPLPFKVPFVPFLPLLCMFINIYLMMELSVITWVRFGVWMFIGECMARAFVLLDV